MAECKNTYEKNIGDAVMLRSYLFGFQASSLAVINYIGVYSLLSSSLNWELQGARAKVRHNHPIISSIFK